ncbi:MAG TPA: hypothetical protein VK618_04295 [Flavitalea sp.]|nr:hypothetical protein [Flavitalea sp.]
MIQLVAEYLTQKKSFSLPGIGTIYIERVPAQSDFVNRQLLPPFYHYRFDRHFDSPDREFFIFLGARKGLEEQEAIRQYNEWTEQLRESLSSRKTSKLEGIGVLKKEAGGELRFEATNHPRSFDIKVHAERLIRSNASHHMLVGDRETTTVVMNDLLHDEHAVRERAWWIYVLVIIALVAVAALVYFFYNRPV